MCICQVADWVSRHNHKAHARLSQVYGSWNVWALCLGAAMYVAKNGADRQNYQYKGATRPRITHYERSSGFVWAFESKELTLHMLQPNGDATARAGPKRNIPSCTVLWSGVLCSGCIAKYVAIMPLPWVQLAWNSCGPALLCFTTLRSQTPPALAIGPRQCSACQRQRKAWPQHSDKYLPTWLHDYSIGLLAQAAGAAQAVSLASVHVAHLLAFASPPSADRVRVRLDRAVYLTPFLSSRSAQPLLCSCCTGVRYWHMRCKHWTTVCS
jgi:hypothetical protein